MALRMPVIELPLDSKQFERFYELFGQYEEKLAKTPGIWQKVNSEFRQSTAAILAQNQAMKELGGGKSIESSWRGMAGWSGRILSNTLGITQQLLKWGTILGGGLLGGSLFGITHMAGDVAGYRRQAMGLGMSIGGMRSFDINMARLGNPGSFLEAINQAVMNPALQGPLYSLGVNPNGSTEQVSISMLKAMRRLALATPRGELGLMSEAYGLGPYGGGTELQILKRMSNGEFGRMLRDEGRNRSAVGIPDKVAQKWTDFTKQMDLAGATIFKTFVVGLGPLADPLAKLSAAFSGFLAKLMSGPLLKEGMDKLADWLNKFSVELTSKKFQAAVDSLVSDTGVISQAFHSLAGEIKDFRQHPVKTAGKAAFDAVVKWPFEGGVAYGNWLLAGAQAPRGLRYNNPGNLRYAGQPGAGRLFGGGGLAAFGTPQEGLDALAKQLLLYRDRGLDTVSGIIGRYAPPGENNTAAYIKDVLARMHVSANSELNLNNPAVLGNLMNAIIRHENANLNPYGKLVRRAASVAIHDDTGGAVGIIVRNKTGGNPVLSAAGLAGVPSQ